MRALNEKSLGRALQHVQQSGVKSFGIVTSWRGHLPAHQNKANFAGLKKHVRDSGHGYTQLKGHWRECQQELSAEQYHAKVGHCPHGWEKVGSSCKKKDASAPDKFPPPHEHCDPDKVKDSVEPSLMVHGVKLDHLKKMMHTHNQDAVVYSGPETKGKPHLVFNNGDMHPIGSMRPHKMAQAYSTIKGKHFTFEGWEYVAQNSMEALIEMHYSAPIEVLQGVGRTLRS